MGSGSDGHDHLAAPLGRWLAQEGVDLLTGGGGGVMAAVCRAFRSVPDRRGLTIGVLPAGPPRGYPNPDVEVVIRTHLAARGEEGTSESSRNHVNVLTSDVIVALPGGAGTRTEVVLALRYGRPLIAWLGSGVIEGLSCRDFPVAEDLAGVQSFVRACRAAARGVECGRKTLDKRTGQSNIT
jgi:uncharacterized protein (TIGR00725 family)